MWPTRCPLATIPSPQPGNTAQKIIRSTMYSNYRMRWQCEAAGVPVPHRRAPVRWACRPGWDGVRTAVATRSHQAPMSTLRSSTTARKLSRHTRPAEVRPDMPGTGVATRCCGHSFWNATRRCSRAARTVISRCPTSKELGRPRLADCGSTSGGATSTNDDDTRAGGGVLKGGVLKGEDTQSRYEPLLMCPHKSGW
jgi:hypothetical protein